MLDPHTRSLLESLRAQGYPIPANEERRLRALARSDLIRKPRPPALSEFVRETAGRFQVPVALVTFLDANYQWIKAAHGSDVKLTPRVASFCQYTVMSEEVFEVEDALADARFEDNYFVRQTPGLRFYAGVPLLDRNHFALGALCIYGYETRRLHSEERKDLQSAGEHVRELLGMTQ